MAKRSKATVTDIDVSRTATAIVDETLKETETANAANAVDAANAAASEQLVQDELPYDPLMMVDGDGKPISILAAWMQNPSQVFEVPASYVVRNDGQNTRGGQKRDLQRLETVIKASGKIDSPAKCYVNVQGKPEVVFGYGRHKVAEKLGLLFPFTIDQAFADPKKRTEGSAIENSRDELTPIETLNTIKMLIAQGHTQVSAGKVIGKNNSYVSYILSLDSIGDRKTVAAIHSGVLGYKEAIELAKIFKTDPVKGQESAHALIAEKTEEAASGTASTSRENSLREERTGKETPTMKKAKEAFEEIGDDTTLSPRTRVIAQALIAYLEGKFKATALSKRLDEAVTGKDADFKTKVKAVAA